MSLSLKTTFTLINQKRMTDLFGSTKRTDTISLIEIKTKDDTDIESCNTILENEIKLPAFPLCEHLIGMQDPASAYLTCLSIYKDLGNHSSQLYLRQRLAKANQKGFTGTLSKKVPNVVWNRTESKWQKQTFDPKDWDWCVSIAELPLFVTWAQQRTRKPKAEKQRLFAKFNIDLDASAIPVPIENEVLDVLQQCMPFVVEFQYRVGKYRLDAFIPRLRLAIQIDENGHKGYDRDEENEYEQVIRDHNIVVIHFNPDEKQHLETPGLALVKQVWARTLSPDFYSFREKFRLL